jgi:hypothetical protein
MTGAWPRLRRFARQWAFFACSRARQGREEDPDQHRDDPDHDQKFDERESAASSVLRHEIVHEQAR